MRDDGQGHLLTPHSPTVRCPMAKKPSPAEEAKLREIVMAVLGEADYDLAKGFDPELSEDLEESERTMRKMIKTVWDGLNDLRPKKEG